MYSSPRAPRLLSAAIFTADPGTTFDFELTPVVAGEYVPGVDTLTGGGRAAESDGRADPCSAAVSP